MLVKSHNEKEVRKIVREKIAKTNLKVKGFFLVLISFIFCDFFRHLAGYVYKLGYAKDKFK